MDIFPAWLGPRGTGTGTGETIYIEVPTSGLQGGRVLKNILVKAKVKMQRKKKKFRVLAKLINK